MNLQALGITIKNSFKLMFLSGVVFLIITLAVSCAPSPWDMPHMWSPFGIPFVGLPFGLIGLGVYFLPTILAAVRHAKSILGIVLLNVFAEWTFVGWIIALIWSLTGAIQKT